MSGFLVNKVEGNKIYPNKMDGIKTGIVLYRNFDAKFEKMLSNSKTVRKIGLNFIIKEGQISAVDEDNNQVSLKLPTGEVPNNLEKMKNTFINQLQKSGDTHYYVENVMIEDENVPFLPVAKFNELRREILKLLSKERLSNYRQPEQKPIGYNVFPVTEMDYHANVYNNEAKSFYENCNCNIVQNALESLETIPSGIELMRTKHCLKFAAGLCGQPCKKLYLTDVKGKKYSLKFDCKNCEMVILNP